MKGHTGAGGAEKPIPKGQPSVFVQDRRGEPLGLAHPAVVRMWMAKGKARLRRTGPATVQIRCAHAEACFIRKRGAGAHVKLGVDPGAKVSGLALIIDSKVVWTAEVHHRSQRISKALTTRRGARSARRCRRKHKAGRPAKPARWKHRSRRPGWLPPSVEHRVASVLRWANEALRHASVDAASVTACVETAGFDAHKVLDPDVEGSAYQQGPLWRTNLRGLVLARDGARCLYCGTTGPMTLDHVVAASKGGAHGPGNRVPACRECNQAKGNLHLETWLDAEPRQAVRRRAKKTLAYTEALARGKVKLAAFAAVNVVGPAIAQRLELDGLNVTRTTGADTAAWRTIAGVAKTHTADAGCTALQGTPAKWACQRALTITMTGRGRRLVIKRNASGFPRLNSRGHVVQGHRKAPPHGLRAGDTVSIGKAGVGRRRRIATLTTARFDGRCIVDTHHGQRTNVMASTLTLVHRGCGSRIQ